jgi:hypothetical protein
VVLCDANFGMQPQDEEFLDDVIRLREKTGYPRAVEASWAKNKSQTFYRIVRKMKAAGLHSSFTIALQTLNDTALREMNRRNMRVNDWQDLVDWLTAEGLECYAELIWGAPGDCVETFLSGYDELAERVSRIAAYPLMVLPNTDYEAKRRELGLITSRGQTDDFEYLLASDTMTFQENLKMQGFLLWARAAAENSFFRYIWRPVRRYAGLTQSQVLFSLTRWFDAQSDPATGPLKSPKAMVEPMAVNAAVRALFLDPRIRELLAQWWQAEIRSLVKPSHQWLVDEAFRFDMLTLPRVGHADEAAADDRGHVRAYRSTERFEADVPAFVAALRAGGEYDSGRRTPTAFEFAWRLGLEGYIDNHEEALLHMATIERSYPALPLAGGRSGRRAGAPPAQQRPRPGHRDEGEQFHPGSGHGQRGDRAGLHREAADDASGGQAKVGR